MRLLFISILGAAVFMLTGAAPALAVHDGSVGECDYCHSMHKGNQRLLKGTDPGSTCLQCHAYPVLGPSSAIVSPKGPVAIQMTPAGDFAWLIVDYRPPSGLPSTDFVFGRTEKRGHSIIARDFGYFQDGGLPVSPGGSYPSAHLTCISCHDPHNKNGRLDSFGITETPENEITGSGSRGDPASRDAPVGVYRLLGSVGYRSGALIFQFPAPDAVSFDDDIHTAYGRGMSEWCSNCHMALLQNIYVSGLQGQKHPAGEGARLTREVVNQYNADLRYSNRLSAYSPLAPVEEGTSDYDTLRLHAGSGGTAYRTDTRANVMCLTCHRAHASPWNQAIRWPYNVSSVHAAAEPDQRFKEERGGWRGVLCNKCHGKD